MQRRSFLALGAAACALPLAGEAPGGPHPSELLGAAGDPPLLAWRDGFYARQQAAGWSTTALAAVLSGLSPDPRILARNATQPEFALPVSDYVNHQATAGMA